MNDRHRELHFAETADQIIATIPCDGAHVLDYGPGDALAAERIAAAAGRLTLCEASDLIRTRLDRRFGGHATITVTAKLSDVPDESVHLAVVSSVVQYLDRAELDTLLADLRRVLVPGGLLLLGDVIRRSRAGADVGSMLRHAARHGFLLATLGALAATVVSPYSRVRMRLGLSRYDEPEVHSVLAAAGFAGRRRQPNLSHDQSRLSFLAERLPDRSAG